MKKIFKSKIVPRQLKMFAEAFPHETWEHFRRRSRRGYKEVKNRYTRISMAYAPIVKSASKWQKVKKI